jgi:hypothetical protein
MSRQLIALATVTLAAGAILSACTFARPSDPSPPTTTRQAKLSSAGCISSSAVVAGVKVDQYGTGHLDVRNYSYSGFDVDVASEHVLASCAIRFFAATYTINTHASACSTWLARTWSRTRGHGEIGSA